MGSDDSHGASPGGGDAASGRSGAGEERLLAYASPSPLAQAGDLFRHEGVLISRDGLILPEQCILCGSPGSGEPVLLSFTWDPSFQVIRKSTLHLRQQGSVRAHLCAHHRRRWRWGRIMGLAGVTASLGVVLGGMITGIASESADIPRYTPLGIGLMIGGFATFICSMFFFTLSTRTLECLRIESGYLYLEGASAAFLEGLPPLPAAAERHE